ncbi:helix-turn-helix domain-containing protein [Shinella sp.]|uniref:helix-turn-helix domain-containing protein n=1 Tax=Shinella sp. TaxID=1870904 RepID=UPI0028AD86D1|nr:helix-turn-helix domain-containing protein [Shinella sp.]
MTGTILAKRYGDYREFAVGVALSGAVRCAWLHSAPVDGFAARVAVVPDGCVDLLWTESGFMIAGPDRTAAFPPMRPGATILGLRFKPGIARHLLRCDLDALTGKVVAFEDLRPGGFSAHHDRLLAADGPVKRLRLLREVFAAEMRELPAMRRDAAALEALCMRLPAAGIAAELGVTERTLRRISTAEFGYGPKTLARILRLQKLLGRIGSSGMGLADLAAETGFADQAHMSRDVLSLTSLTPGEILRQMRG